MKKFAILVFLFSVNVFACDAFDSAKNLINSLAKSHGAQNFRLGPGFKDADGLKTEILYFYNFNSDGLKTTVGKIEVNNNTCVPKLSGALITNSDFDISVY
jgi:hypothetical protein